MSIRPIVAETVTPPDLFSAIETDMGMRYLSMRFAELQAQHTPDTYAYLFTWNKSPVMGGVLGASHGLDIPFLFGLGKDTWAGEGPAPEALSAKT